MAVNSFNGSSLVGVQLGFTSMVPSLSGGGISPTGGTLQPTITPTQVMGLSPLFSCCSSTVIPGTNGCQSFTINSVTGGTVNPYNGGNYSVFNITFIPLAGAPQFFNFVMSFPSFVPSTSFLAGIIVGSLAGKMPAGFTAVQQDNVVKICSPNNPFWYGVKVSIVVSFTTGWGSWTSSPSFPSTLTLGTTSTISYDTSNCGDCRQGNYTPDIVPDDKNLQMTVFADPNSTGYMTSDYNSWLIQYPTGYDAVGSGDFTLQKQIGGSWTKVRTLNDTTVGRPFNNNLGTHKFPFYPGYPYGFSPLPTCTTSNFQGFFLDWRLVFNLYGGGVYRFSAQGTTYGGGSYCLLSNPFCLSQFSCHAADTTVKLETQVTGGNRGSVTTQGQYWSLSCNDANPFFWQDSIRFYGFFGKQTDDLTRDQIKYQTGIITKVRDELIKKYELWISPMPQWFHDRISAYALMADKLYVTDDNYNNANYNLQHFWVVADSGYEPAHKFESRYARIEGTVKFKEGQQFVFADRC